MPVFESNFSNLISTFNYFYLNIYCDGAVNVKVEVDLNKRSNNTMAIGDIGEFTTLSLGTNVADPADRAKLFFRAKNSLSTDGSLTIDQNDLNDGTLNPDLDRDQSPGLVFGSSSGEGIASNRSEAGNQNGLDFYTNSMVRLSITNSGNVGIGTSSLPAEKLEVDGIVKATSFVQEDGTSLSSKVSKAGDTITGALTIQSALAESGNVQHPLTIQGEGSTFLNIKANNGTHEVLLGADTTGGILSTPSDHDLHLRAGRNNAIITIKTNGNVGIGTSTPTEELEVRGSVKATEFIGRGSKLVGVLKSRTAINRTITINANAEVRIRFLISQTDDHRFFVISVVPDTIGATVNWFSSTTRSSQGIEYALVIRNLTPQIIQVKYFIRIVEP
jgi:hypothetical protein